MGMDGYSLSDLAAVADGNNGFMGGGNCLAWILLFALFGGGFGGWGNRGQQCATTDELSAGFNFSGVNNKLDAITAAITNEGRTTDNAICQLGYQALEQTSALSKQLAECCCATQQAIHAEGEATRSMIQQDKIESLQQQVNALNLQNALCGVVRYPTQTTYGAGYSPFFGGCGCGSCC